MTEPIFALVFVIALRLHHRGKTAAGMIIASLMILARPEGFFLGVLWALWVLRIHSGRARHSTSLTIDKTFVANKSAIRIQHIRPKSAIKLLLLATGSFLWWLAALLLTGDPLFIKHNWPNNWPITGTVYGAHGLIAYSSRLPEAVGLFLLPVFCMG